MKDILIAAQLIISALFIMAIILQSKGTGLGQAWGGAGEMYRSKRGVERLLFRATVILAVFFFITSTLVSIF